MVIYLSQKEYLQSKQTLIDKIAAIDNLISNMELTLVSATGNDDIKEYWLNDGQIQIKYVYRGVAQMQASIEGLEKLKQRYLNRLTGRVSRGIDSKNITGHGWY